MISGTQIPPRDIWSCLFPSLTVWVGATKLDAFNAMTSSLYSEVNVGIHDDNSPTVPEMALHLRLNVAAFYHRCDRFPFTSGTMVEWCILVVEEYEYLVKTKTVAQMGLSEFHVLSSFLEDRLQWKDNFTLLGRRLTNAPGGPKPPLWFDMYALQMLFSQHGHPVFISTVYGCLIEKDLQDVQAYPHVPSLKRVQWLPGLRDLEAGEYPSSFTVIPILALDTATLTQIIYTGRNETHLGLCKKLIEFIQNQGRVSHFFVVSPGSSSSEVKPRCHQAGWTVFACITERTLQPPRTTLNVLDVGRPFMLNVVIFDAVSTTKGSPLLALCGLNFTEERCMLLPTILTSSRRLTKARRTKVRSNRSLVEVCRKKVPSRRLMKARRTIVW
jgi:hypothetical protein